MPATLIPVDLRREPDEQTIRPHNRWHPEIPAAATVRPGDIFRMECFDCTGGQILNSDSADDVAAVDLDGLTYLTGPVAVEGARPGDLLVVDILDLGPLPGAEWGYTAILDRSLGVAELADDYPAPRKAIWDLNGIFASSRHLGGIRFAGMAHPGVIGCAPSAELMRVWNAREASVLATRAERFVRGVAIPRAKGALLGHLGNEDVQRVAAEAPRTWAARENGGSIDVKELVPGTRAYLPVHVDGANLSVGDLQFSQGDGKVTGFGGIKMAGWIDLQVNLIPDGVVSHGVESPVFQGNGAGRCPGNTVTFQGISIDKHGEQQYLDIWTAYQHACRSAIRYIERFGYTGEQAYALLGSAPVQGRISCMLEHPNVCCTLALPTDIFDFDIEPGAPVPAALHRGELASPA